MRGKRRLSGFTPYSAVGQRHPRHRSFLKSLSTRRSKGFQLSPHSHRKRIPPGGLAATPASHRENEEEYQSVEIVAVIRPSSCTNSLGLQQHERERSGTRNEDQLVVERKEGRRRGLVDLISSPISCARVDRKCPLIASGHRRRYRPYHSGEGILAHALCYRIPNGDCVWR